MKFEKTNKNIRKSASPFRGLGCLLLILIFCFPTMLLSQEFVWKAGVNSFFDNQEFAGSSVQDDQTMAGVRISPEIGFSWQGNHRIFAGFDAMREFGSNKIIDFADLIAYYDFSGERFRFYMGAFPRRMALGNYPRMFFADSIGYFRPVLNGLFWEYFKNDNYLNVWLDWTSRQTAEVRETFFMGWSGRYNWNIFYAQHFGYMFHFAHRADSPRGNLHDNGLMLTSFGIDFAQKTNFSKLEANVGWSVGLERNRGGDNRWHTPNGFLSELKIEYRGLGIFNTFYAGGKQQIFYDEYGNSLYWGDRFYRTKRYNRTDLYYSFFRTNVVNLKFVYSFHFAERNMYHQQVLLASFNL